MRSIEKATEVIEVLQPQDSISESKKWLDKAYADLKKEFDNNKDLTPAQKIKIVEAIQKQVDKSQSDHPRLIQYIKALPEDKMNFFKTYLKATGFLEEKKKKSDELLF